MRARKDTRRMLHYCGYLLCFIWLLALLTAARPSAAAGERVRVTRVHYSVVMRSVQETRTLGPGETVERELAGGQAHVYEFMLAADNYMRLVVEQRGIDVVVRLFAPGGEKLLEADSPNGMQGSESLSFIASAPGSYRLEVRALDKDAAAGRYEIKVEESRVVTTEGKRRIAEETQAAADRIFEQKTSDSALSSAQIYEQALLFWQAVGDLVKQVDVLNTLGNIYRENFFDDEVVDVKSITYYERALPLAQAAGYKLGEARTLYNLASHQSNLGEFRRALDYADRSLSLVRAVGNRQREATVLHWIAELHILLGEPQRALDFHLQSLELSREIQDFNEEAKALDSLMLLYSNLGDREKAFAYAKMLLEHYRGAQSELEAGMRYNVGLTQNRFGEWRAALDNLNQSLTKFRSLHAPYGEAISLLEIGRATYKLGDRQKALENLEAALTVLRKFDAPGGPTQRRAQVYMLMGEIYSDSGNQEKALELYDQALRIHIDMDTVGWGVADVRAAIARAEYRRGNLPAALPYIEAALEFSDSFRAKVAGHDLRASYFASVADNYEFYIDLLMQLHKSYPAKGFDLKALQASERARARSLLDMLAEARADIRRGVDPELLARERELQRLLREHESRLAQLRESGRASGQLAEAARNELEATLIRYQEVQGLIRQRSPHYSALTQSQALNLIELQSRVLNPETLLLEYSLGKERSYLWLLRQTPCGATNCPDATRWNPRRSACTSY